MINTTPSIHGNTLFEEFRKILYKHLDSRITADSIVNRMVDEEGIDPMRLNTADLEKVFGSVVFLSVRMFCPADRLPTAMIELAGLMSDTLRHSLDPHQR